MLTLNNMRCAEADRLTDEEVLAFLGRLNSAERENVLFDWYWIGMSRVRCRFLRFMADVRSGVTIETAFEGSFR